VTTPLVRQEITAVVAADAHKPAGGQLTLDALGVPYGSATIEFPLNDDTALNDFDPRTDARVVITATDVIRGMSRTFDFGIRSREVDYVARTVSVDAATDEALLQDYAQLTLDEGTREHEDSLREIVTYVLAKIGAVLEAGSVDAAMTAAWAVTNQFPNPNSIGDLTAFTQSTNANGIALVSGSSPWPGGSPDYVRWAATAAGASFVRHTSAYSVIPGRQYTASAWFRASVAGQGVRWMFRSWAGDTRISDVSTIQVPVGTSNVYVSGTYVAPPGVTKVEVFAQFQATAAANAIAMDGSMFYEGEDLVTTFTGSSAPDALYTYTWSGTVNASPSTRNPIVERDPSLFLWKPGTTAWDFLEPFTSQSGLRLFCDEARKWRLIDPGTYTVPGFVRLSAYNAIKGTDTISRQDADVFATGVVVRYVWEDPDGTTRTGYDAAGTPGKVFVVDQARAYPGPGAAAAILSRRNGTGRTQDVDALTDWTATPGNDASIVLPDAPEQQGAVSSVRFSLGDDAAMSVGTRGLVEIPAGSWLAWTPPDQAWTAVPDTVTWVSLPA